MSKATQAAEMLGTLFSQPGKPGTAAGALAVGLFGRGVQAIEKVADNVAKQEGVLGKLNYFLGTKSGGFKAGKKVNSQVRKYIKDVVDADGNIIHKAGTPRYGKYRWSKWKTGLAAAGVVETGAVGARVLSGGGIYKDGDGNTDLVGIPFW